MFLQKGQKAIRHTSEESVSNDCVNEPSSESDSSRHSRPFAYQLLVANQKERKSVCLWSARRKVVAILLGLLMVVCFVGIAFIVQAIRKKTTTTSTTTATATTMTSTTREVCFNGPSTLHCEAARNAVVDIQWRLRVPGMDEWIKFAHCNQSGRCVVTRPMLTKGIQVLNSSLDTVTLQRIAENKTNYHARIMCQVHYPNYPSRVNIYEIKFSATCVWIPKGRDLNLTRILLNMLSCERVVDIDLFNVNGSRFAHCNSCQACTKTNSTDGNHLMPVFWNRLRVKRGSLLLTGIQENDDGRTIKVKVHMQTPRRDNGTNMDYTLTIFVNSSRGSPGTPSTDIKEIPRSTNSTVNEVYQGYNESDDYSLEIFVVVFVTSGIFYLFVIFTSIYTTFRKVPRKCNSGGVNFRMAGVPLIPHGLDLPIKDLTIDKKTFIARRLNGKDMYGYFYWQIIAEKLDLIEECRAWGGAENPTEKLLTAYGEKEGSTIRSLIVAVREAELTYIAIEIEQRFSITRV